MKVVVLHNLVDLPAAWDNESTLTQVNSVAKAAARLGHDVRIMAITMDFKRAAAELRGFAPDFVFNLTEGLEGVNHFLFVGPMLLELLRIPYAGCSWESLHVTTNKVLTKRLLVSAGIATPHWIDLGASSHTDLKPGATYLLKPVSEDASVGLHEDEIKLLSDKQQILETLHLREKRDHHPWFAEEYVDGREFNISVLSVADAQRPDGFRAQVLPPAEIVFKGFDPQRPKVVGYKAKWDLESFEYKNTVRLFAANSEDNELLAKLRMVTLQCWELFGLSGYARVDFRVDKLGQVQVLEVNANPCIDEDAGFIAAGAQVGLSYDDVISAICAKLIRPL